MSYLSNTGLSFLVSNYGLEEPNQEVAALISHAAQERLKNLVEKLAVIAEHRIDLIKVKTHESYIYLFQTSSRDRAFIKQTACTVRRWIRVTR